MYRMIQLESLIPETLPGVSLFIKHGDNHVLYKNPELSFSQNDKERLLDNNVRPPTVCGAFHFVN